ncbi:MAG: hypothetical protein PVF57_20385 [Pseudomonadales bacterium]|jgi:hypothetical protein
MERFFVDRYGAVRVDVWCAALVALLVSYLLSVIVLLNALGLSGWDLAGGFVASLACPGVLGAGLFYLFQPLKDRHIYGRNG